MKEFTIYAVLLLALTLLLGLSSLTQAEDKANAAVTLDGVSLGEHVLGPKLDAEDLAGKVVLFKYWGDQCPPCIASIPHMMDVRDAYSSDQLAIVANQVWTKKTENTMKAWRSGGGKDTITVINHGELMGANHTHVPHAYLLDHNGNKIWEGNPHPKADGKELDIAIEKAVKDLPSKG